MPNDSTQHISCCIRISACAQWEEVTDIPSATWIWLMFQVCYITSNKDLTLTWSTQIKRVRFIDVMVFMKYQCHCLQSRWHTGGWAVVSCTVVMDHGWGFIFNLTAGLIFWQPHGASCVFSTTRTEDSVKCWRQLSMVLKLTRRTTVKLGQWDRLCHVWCVDSH